MSQSVYNPSIAASRNAVGCRNGNVARSRGRIARVPGSGPGKFGWCVRNVSVHSAGETAVQGLGPRHAIVERVLDRDRGIVVAHRKTVTQPGTRAPARCGFPDLPAVPVPLLRFLRLGPR